jgi:serine/threonine-protein kinase/endoribonuclease IRE1
VSWTHGGLLIILAVYCIPILQLAHAQQQRIPALEPRDAPPGLRHDGGSQPAPQDAAVYQFEATVIDDSGVTHTRPSTPKRQSHVKHEKRDESVVDALHGQSSLDKQPRPQKHKLPNLNDYENIIIPNDASALATLAPASSVRAPHPLRHQNPSSIPASGLSSPHVARSLEDWEVEDFVLMATVDGDLYANDRKTGKELWHLEVDQPMVETKHHRPNSSALDEDYNPMDHYIWVVEPNRDGGLYWIPDSKAGLVRTGFTMKSLVELAPFSSGDPPIVYTGDKKTTLITLDAATGKVLKWFGSSGS